MREWLALLHLILTPAIILWDVGLAGKIAQRRQATKPFALLTAFAGFLILPAFIVALATTTLITGRAIAAIDWLWPVAILLITAQSIYALARRFVHPLLGYPIAFYNIVIALAAVARFFTAHGSAVSHPFLLLMAAEVDALALTTTEAAIASPFYLHVPIVSPAFPALSRVTAGVRGMVATLAVIWFGVILAEIPRANIAIASYSSQGAERVHDRPDGFHVGLKVFPDIAREPTPAALTADRELLQMLSPGAVSVTIVPGASMLAIDSVARALSFLPRDSTILIAALGYRGTLLPELTQEGLDAETRLRTLHRVLERLRPDIVLPAQDPYGIGARVLGRLPVEEWQAFYTRAAALVQDVRPRTLVALTASAYDSRDSALFAWALEDASPIEAAGFSLYPNRLGARALDASLRAAERWMAAHPSRKPLWVFGAGAFPLAHGEQSQGRAILATMAWATGQPRIRGVVVMEANDYGRAMGLRAPNGRYRHATGEVQRIARTLRESATRAVAVRPDTIVQVRDQP